MRRALRSTFHIVAPGIESIAELCRVERVAHALPGVRRVALLELRGGVARLALRADAGSDPDALARAIADARAPSAGGRA